MTSKIRMARYNAAYLCTGGERDNLHTWNINGVQVRQAERFKSVKNNRDQKAHQDEIANEVNAGANDHETALRIVETWLDSDGHCKKVMNNGKYGIGVITGCAGQFNTKAVAYN
ncbi:MAG: hypothetical protein AAGF11_09260 [Myxococcota bacterium]